MQTKSELTYITSIIKADLQMIAELIMTNEIDANFVCDKNGNTGLHLAAKAKNADIVDLLLNLGAKADVKNVLGETPLELAMDNNDERSIKALIERAGSENSNKLQNDPMVIESKKRPASDQGQKQMSKRDLYIDALRNNNLVQLKKCLEQGVSVNIRIDKEGSTALLFAVQSQNEDMMKILLEKGADPEIMNSKCLTPLEAAVLQGPRFVKIISQYCVKNEASSVFYKKMLERSEKEGGKNQADNGFAVTQSLKPSQSIKNKDDDNNSELHQNLKKRYVTAFTNGDIQNLKFCLEVGVSPDVIIDANNNTALHIAIQQKNFDLVKLLLSFNAKLTIENDRRLTPLQIAINANDLDCINLIIDNDKNNAYKHLCIEALYISAIRNKKYNLLIEYFTAGVSPNVPIDEDKNTGLHHAIAGNNAKLVELFLLHNADINYKNAKGVTPVDLALNSRAWGCLKIIMKETKLDEIKLAKCQKELFKYALEKGFHDEVQYLMATGISPNIPIDENNNTALHYAVHVKNMGLIKLLLSYSASVLYANKSGETPLQLAINEKNKNLIQSFIDVGWLSKEESVQCYNALYTLKFKESSNEEIGIFLANGASPDLKIDDNGNRGLHFAIEQKNTLLLRILIYYNANIACVNNAQVSPLDKVSNDKAWDYLKLFIENGPNNFQLFKQAMKEWYLNALQNKNSEDIKFLLQQGLSPDIMIDVSGNTGLHCAVQNDANDIVQLLLQRQPNIVCKNAKGHTAIEVAIQKNNWVIIDLFLKYYLSINADLGPFEAVLVKAIEAKKFEAIKILLNAKLIKYFASNEGENYFKTLMQQKDYHDVVHFLFNEDKSGIIKELILKFGKLPESMIDSFADIVEMEEIKDPYISPQGSSFDKNLIGRLKEDPQTRESLQQDDFIPNKKFIDLLAYYKLPNIDLAKFPPALVCPETGKIYKEPVVAMDGFTYEKKWLEDYLTKHGNVTPKGVKQTKNLSLDRYANRMVMELIENKYADVVVGSPKTNIGFFAQPKDNHPEGKAEKMDIDAESEGNQMSFT